MQLRRLWRCSRSPHIHSAAQGTNSILILRERKVTKNILRISTFSGTRKRRVGSRSASTEEGPGSSPTRSNTSPTRAHSHAVSPTRDKPRSPVKDLSAPAATSQTQQMPPPSSPPKHLDESKHRAPYTFAEERAVVQVNSHISWGNDILL